MAPYKVRTPPLSIIYEPNVTQSRPPNATATKFGYPQTLIGEFGHWAVVLRPHQVTLGALVLVCTDPAEAFSDISDEAFAEMSVAIGAIENGLATFRPYQKINYLMLMMKDKDVHFHVVPRYEVAQGFDDQEFPDAGWPGPPDLGSGPTPAPDELARIASAIRGAWPRKASESTAPQSTASQSRASPSKAS
jgi:diadenosine tetraphosphate (Ap4A) HIT family hydrolase